MLVVYFLTEKRNVASPRKHHGIAHSCEGPYFENHLKLILSVDLNT